MLLAAPPAHVVMGHAPLRADVVQRLVAADAVEEAAFAGARQAGGVGAHGRQRSAAVRQRGKAPAASPELRPRRGGRSGAIDALRAPAGLYEAVTASGSPPGGW